MLRISTNIYPDVRLNEVQGYNDAVGTSLWLASLLRESKCFKRAATSVDDEWLSSHDVFYGSRPLLSLLSFFQSAYNRVPHQRNCYHLLDETKRVVYSRDVTWHHPEPALGILVYINFTSCFGITYQKGTLGVDYASKATDRRSVSGRVIMCGHAWVGCL